MADAGGPRAGQESGNVATRILHELLQASAVSGAMRSSGRTSLCGRLAAFTGRMESGGRGHLDTARYGATWRVGWAIGCRGGHGRIGIKDSQTFPARIRTTPVHYRSSRLAGAARARRGDGTSGSGRDDPNVDDEVVRVGRADPGPWGQLSDATATS